MKVLYADPVGCGPKGIRTPDLMAASHALYQLSYGPVRTVSVANAFGGSACRP
jgi:hypothetical protein